ncbi:MAG: hypothetical protein ACQEXJ_04025 [Myxococcota bacterium]
MIRRIRIGLVVALGVLTVLEVVLPLGMSETKPWWHHTTGYFGVYGLLACAALVYVAKFAGKLGLQQPEPSPEAERRAPLDPAEPPAERDEEGLA